MWPISIFFICYPPTLWISEGLQMISTWILVVSIVIDQKAEYNRYIDQDIAQVYLRLAIQQKISEWHLYTAYFLFILRPLHTKISMYITRLSLGTSLSNRLLIYIFITRTKPNHSSKTLKDLYWLLANNDLIFTQLINRF